MTTAAPARSRPVGSYTVAMLAAHWGVSDDFVYDQLAAGRLRAFKLGNKLWRIKPEAVKEYEVAAELRQPSPVIEPANDPAIVAAEVRRARRATKAR